jgi:hypothetical protein
MAGATGTATINFGAFPGSNEATVAVTGQTGISATSKADAWVMSEDTSSNHTANDHRYLPQLASFACGTPTTGVGFSIYGTSIHKLSGEFTLKWVWSD